MADPATTGATAVEPPQTTQLVNEDGSFAEGWSDKYGEKNKDHLSRYKTFDDLVNSHLNTKSKLGIPADELVRIPKDDSPDDVKLAWKKANGWSENEDDYKYEIDESLKTKIQVDDKKLAAARTFLKDELGLSPARAKKALDYYYQDKAKDIDDYGLVFEQQKKESYEKGIGILKQHLGTDFDVRSARARALLQKFGERPLKTPDGEVLPLEKLFEEVPRLKNSAWMTIILDNIAESLSEDTLKGITKPTMPTGEQIEQQIKDLREKYNALPRNDHKGQEAIRQQITNLYKQKHS